MGKVSKEVVKAVIDEVDKLDEAVKDKCSLCNITLTDIVKRIEVSSNASVSTVCNTIAKVLNRSKSDGEKISAEALRQRVLNTEGKRKNVSKTKINYKNKYLDLKIKYNTALTQISELTDKVEKLTSIIVEYVDKEASDI